MIWYLSSNEKYAFQNLNQKCKLEYFLRKSFNLVSFYELSPLDFGEGRKFHPGGSFRSFAEH